jgi:tripartite-type tricarboxylate transporter receptor subunit TctC
MTLTRRSALATSFAATAAGSAFFAAPAIVRAQAWPAKPVRIVVPFGPGGPADVYARQIGSHLTDVLKQQFVIENKPGAGAIIGTEIVAKAPADGYTLLMMSNTHTVNETLQPNKSYVLLRDLMPVAPVNYSDLVMVVHPGVAAKTLQEFVALAKAEPGKLAYASSGPGTPYHMAGELFKSMSGTDILHVPHKNSGDARNAVVGGHVQMMLDAVTAMKGSIDGGTVRALGSTGKARSGVMPDLPTVSEAGVPGYEATIWLGLMAPAGTSNDIVEKLNVEIGKIVMKGSVREAWAKQGAAPMTMSPETFGAYMKADIEKWAKVIKQADIKLQ